LIRFPSAEISISTGSVHVISGRLKGLDRSYVHTLCSLVKGRVFDNVCITSQLANDAAIVFVNKNNLAVCRALGIVVPATRSIVSWVVLFQGTRGLGWGSAF
ncbi:hypothetical protein KCU81_g573, partial [Aureobasidium melanogenum]